MINQAPFKRVMNHRFEKRIDDKEKKIQKLQEMKQKRKQKQMKKQMGQKLKNQIDHRQVGLM
jgi:hypothetical protein